MRVAVITPYHSEPTATLERCLASVRTQSHLCTHFMVADGVPHPNAAAWDVEHIVLPNAHADNGNTPRAIGAMSALNMGYDAFAFLDADNWFAPDHVRIAVEAMAQTQARVVISDRQIVLSTGEYCEAEDEDLRARAFADTSSLIFHRAVGHLLPVWGMMDQTLSPICDRVMFCAIKAKNIEVHWTGLRTLFYESRWGPHFAALGKPPPHDVHTTDWDGMRKAYDPGLLSRRLGFDPFALASPFETASGLEASR